MDLTVVSPDEPKARKLAGEYRSTHVVFLRGPGLPYKVVNRVRNLWNRKRRSYVSAYYARALATVKKAGPFGAVVIEGGPCDAMAPYEDYCGDALMYHLHYDPTTPECAVTMEEDEWVVDLLADALRELSGDFGRLESMSRAASLRSREFTEESFYREFVETIDE